MIAYHTPLILRRNITISCISSQKSIKGKTPSSSRWLQRQMKDPLVSQTKRDNYRCRSAYKLIELDNKYRFLNKGTIAVDLGARPGAWSQVASKRIGTGDIVSANKSTNWDDGIILAVDVETMDEIPGVHIMDKADITNEQVQRNIINFLMGHEVNVVMSDMAPNASGSHTLDHQRIMELGYAAFEFSKKCLKEGGVFVCKLWQGSLLNGFKTDVKKSFESVEEVRLKTTRKQSSEVYIVAQKYIT